MRLAATAVGSTGCSTDGATSLFGEFIVKPLRVAEEGKENLSVSRRQKSMAGWTAAD